MAKIIPEICSRHKDVSSTTYSITSKLIITVRHNFLANLKEFELNIPISLCHTSITITNEAMDYYLLFYKLQ